MTTQAVWRPLAKVRFQLRIEDFADDAPKPGPPTVPNAGSESFGLGQEHQKLVGIGESIGYDIIPTTVALERNSYRKADTARISVPLAFMPFDPRVIRSATIQIFGGTVDSVEYSDAMSGSNAPGLMLPDFRLDGTPNEVFRGFVDDWEIEVDGKGRLQVTARDFTSFFTDAELPKNALKDIPSATRLDNVIRLLIFGDGLPAAASRRTGLAGVRGLAVVNDTDEQLPRLSDFKPPSWFDSKKTVKKGRKRSNNDGQKMSYWDMITDLCVSAGFIVYIRPVLGVTAAAVITELVISSPRTYYKTSTTNGDDIVDESKVRRFWSGLNAHHLKLRRNLEGAKVPTIEIRSWDERAGETHVGRFPVKPKNNQASVSGAGDREEIKVIILRDISGPGAQGIVDRAARSIYEQLARGEFEVSFDTSWLSALPINVDPDFDVGVSDPHPDMFQMAAGEPVMVDIDKALEDQGRVSLFTALQALPLDAKIKALTTGAIRPDLARAVATAGESQFLQREFRVQRLMMNYGNVRGWSFNINAINYLDIRHAVDNGE